MPLSHCPRCGKRLSAYQRFPQCSGCGWQPLPENPPRLPPLRRPPQARDPWWYRWEYFQGMASYVLVVAGWRVWRGWCALSDGLGLTKTLYYRLPLLYLLWGGITCLPFGDPSLWQDWRLIAGIPMGLSWALLYCCVRLVPFPSLKSWSREQRQWVQKVLLGLAPSLRRHTVTGTQCRPQWVALQGWVSLTMLGLGMLLGSFLLGLTGLIVAVASWVSLLF